ncbi:type IV fimbrial biogenesis protein FimT [Variovorax boronicumulans]|uniref:GspH/FimT family pseudopilin n=1 Tax=Variovorax boronicumulans TaxID=436515 RepID=UPI002476EA8D|nr:GspH/FimT family pseudopilin [Variovorax boronicumulans]MDH6166172.1 type IV fimbrial biogenesis protein FimT [Variovorax boronicumulans]
MLAMKCVEARTSSGFTLVELMVVVAILAVLGAIGVPSFRDMLLNQRLATAAQGFGAALSFARMEAIQRAQGVEVIALAGGDWSEGWVVRTWTNDVYRTLRRFDRLPQGVSIDTTLGGGFAQGLRYDGNGFSRQTAKASFSAGCLTLKAETGRRASIIVSASGRAKVCNPDVSGDCGLGACGRGEKEEGGT